jgi:mannitol/fructose-specific phosphotransferase system IIA component (Ntr-type)
VEDEAPQEEMAEKACLDVGSLETIRRGKDTANVIVSKLKRENVDLLMLTFGNAHTRSESIQELAGMIADRHHLDRDLIASEVMKQESVIPSGIGNHFAIPHAKLSIPNPVAGVAINQAGIDFEAPDGLPAEIILMLLTLGDNLKLQFQYLSEIAGRFDTPQKVGRFLKAASAEEFLRLLSGEK